MFSVITFPPLQWNLLGARIHRKVEDSIKEKKKTFSSNNNGYYSQLGFFYKTRCNEGLGDACPEDYTIFLLSVHFNGNFVGFLLVHLC